MKDNKNPDSVEIYKNKAKEILPTLNGFKIFEAEHILDIAKGMLCQSVTSLKKEELT